VIDTQMLKPKWHLIYYDLREKRSQLQHSDEIIAACCASG